MGIRDEIFEQVAVSRRLLETQWEPIKEIAEQVKSKGIKYIFLAARGTSDNAGLYVKYLFGMHNRIPVSLAAPSMFSVYHAPPRLEGALVLVISQSGQSPDILRVVEEGNRQGQMTLAITNNADSPLAEVAGYVIDIQAGEEKAVAATKTYTAQLLAAAMLSTALHGGEEYLAALRRTPETIEQVLTLEPLVQAAGERYFYMEQCVVVGRGYNYATAFEWALKMKEMTYSVSEPYSSADFMHGPIAMVESGFPVFLVAPQGKVHKQLYELAVKLVEQKNANLLILSNDDEILKFSPSPLKLPEDMPEWISPVVSIVPAQLFCFNLARLRGFDPENPRGLSKVTLTE
jgi:glucosamine--fructose-6-phosphate aminotransferase (isomerizing)